MRLTASMLWDGGQSLPAWHRLWQKMNNESLSLCIMAGGLNDNAGGLFETI
jgi:hypothetical protein